MAQDKEEAAIPGDAAPDETAPVSETLTAEIDDSTPDAPTHVVADAPDVVNERGPAASVSDDDRLDVESPVVEPAGTGTERADDDATESSESGPGVVAPDADLTPDDAPAKPETVHRILPARSSVAAFGAAAFTPKATWTHLRTLTVCVVVAWVLIAFGLICDQLTGLSSLFCNGVYGLAVVAAAALPVLDLVRRIRQFAVPTVLLTLVAAIGAIVTGRWRDAAILLACYVTLLALHELILRRSEDPLRTLTAARSSHATLAGATVSIPIEEVTAGDTIRVGMNELVPLDGILEAESTTVDQSIVTGSAEPVEKARGSDLYAGSRNLGGEIELRVARRPSQRTIARVARLAQHALPHPSRAQQMLDEVAGKYAMSILITDVVLFLILLTLGDHSWRISLERTAAFLVVASPAPLILTVATAYRSAMANGIRHGVLFRGQDELETLGTVKTIAFDKTGTLTQGKPVVTGVVNCDTGWTDDEILLRAASAEVRSGHRLGLAIVNAARAGALDLPEATEFIPSPGKGIMATVDGRTVAVGNANLFAELGVNIWRAIEISADMRDEGQSAVLVGDRENVRGVIGVSDPLRLEAPEIVADLSNLKIHRTAMLTGDDEVVANVIANEAGLREVYADLLPEEKLGVVRQMEQSAPVGMIAGAGENSPTLAIATSGIALGSVSSDVTREPAGVLLFGGELSELPFALWISQHARRTTNVGLIVLIAVMAVLATGSIVVGIPLLVVIIIWFIVTLLVLLVGFRLQRATRRLSLRRAITNTAVSDVSRADVSPPKSRYVIDDDEEDDDEL